MSRLLAVAVALMCLAFPAWAQQDKASFELTPFGGYRFGGTFEVEWDGRDDAGRALASGVYLARIAVDTRSETRKMTLLK